MLLLIPSSPVLRGTGLLAWTHSLPHPLIGAAKSAQPVKTVSDVASHETAKSMALLGGTFRVSFRLCSTLPSCALPRCTGICIKMTTVRIDEVHLCIAQATHQATQSAVRIDF